MTHDEAKELPFACLECRVDAESRYFAEHPSEWDDLAEENLLADLAAESTDYMPFPVFRVLDERLSRDAVNRLFTE